MTTDDDSFTVLWERHRTDVRKVARDIFKRNGTDGIVAQFMLAGQIALWEASLRYKPEDNPYVSFWAYAKHRVRGAMLDELRAWDTVSRYARKVLQSGIAPETVCGLFFRVSSADASNVVARDNPEETVADREEVTKVLGALNALLPAEKVAVVGTLNHKTLEEIACELGLTPGRICQLKKAAVGKIREQLKIS
jgi:RNA polymerase sigma factor (sigma-70 family)